MLETLDTTGNVLLMLLGFGLIIVVHELGHFLAARWAGIRVHAFAVGFGKAIFSWRKGLGFRVGSSDLEYQRLERAAQLPPADDDGVPSEVARRAREKLAALSPTEYRLNWFPFGGYVRMLGQEDLNPSAASKADDSYTSKPVWKRMIVISGGVFMNVILAGLLFMGAYLFGLREMAPVIGSVAPGSAAAEAGIEPGDVVLEIDGKPAETFNDLFIASAMGEPGDPIELRVARIGATDPVTVEATATKGGDLGLLQLGVGPGVGAGLVEEFESPSDRERFDRRMASVGFEGALPGMEVERFARVSGSGEVSGAGDVEFRNVASLLFHEVRESGGAPIRVTLRDDERSVEGELFPQTDMQRAELTTHSGDALLADHLAGLTPVMAIEHVMPGSPADRAGLRAGDVFARMGTVEWPSVPAGRAQLGASAGRDIGCTVWRDGDLVEITARVTNRGTLGFYISDGSATAPIVRGLSDASLPSGALESPIEPGTRVTAVDGVGVSTFASLSRELRLALQSRGQAVLTLEYEIGSETIRDEQTLVASPEQLEAISALGWNAQSFQSVFTLNQFMNVASNPIDAIGKGVHRTHYIMTMTYLTFLRLVQGSVPVDQLHGPVGITHIGSRVADQGFVYLIFFLGLISANLAVVNFLPLPIVDGGHMVFLAIEGITRKPVSIAVQNIATLAGLALIGTAFIVVTFNDIMRLVG